MGPDHPTGAEPLALKSASLRPSRSLRLPDLWLPGSEDGPKGSKKCRKRQFAATNEPRFVPFVVESIRRRLAIAPFGWACDR
jgi:hypothetical protein